MGNPVENWCGGTHGCFDKAGCGSYALWLANVYSDAVNRAASVAVAESDRALFPIEKGDVS
jgi:hypothetical protein